ncbi:phage minor head protein [Pseudoalteromonas luteoviolacea]|nr:phage minor head protein [Pseudoalteromonas luteoviolacea]
MMAVEYGDLPFNEAITFFRDKLSLPSESWDEIWQEAHDHAFIIAGAIEEDLLESLRDAVDKAIADGMSLKAFQSQFIDIVQRAGWDYVGKPGWRSHVIYETNLRQSYNAGRYQQLQAIKETRPFWMYKHGNSESPRVIHLQWDTLTLHADDPWWRAHYPSNGWGCKCRVLAMNERDLQRLGLSVGKAPDNGMYDWVNKKTGEVHEVPVGIDPGFDYAPGAIKPSERLAQIREEKRNGRS